MMVRDSPCAQLVNATPIRAKRSVPESPLVSRPIRATIIAGSAGRSHPSGCIATTTPQSARQCQLASDGSV